MAEVCGTVTGSDVPNDIPGWWNAASGDEVCLASKWTATVNEKQNDVTALTVLRTIAHAFVHQAQEKITSAVIQQIWAFAAPLVNISRYNRERSTALALLSATVSLIKGRKGAHRWVCG